MALGRPRNRFRIASYLDVPPEAIQAAEEIQSETTSKRPIKISPSERALLKEFVTDELQTDKELISLVLPSVLSVECVLKEASATTKPLHKVGALITQYYCLLYTSSLQLFC